MIRSNRKKTIWLFGGGDMQELAAQKIINSGYKLILTDSNPDCFCRKYASEFINLSTFDIEGNLRVAKSLKKKYDIKTTFTSGTDCHEIVACVAKFLNLHGVAPDISKICRYKFKTRQVLAKAGIRQPKFQKVRSFKEAKLAAKKIGLPVVLKASDNSGSRGFLEIKKLNDLTPVSFNNTRESSATNTGYVLMEERLCPLDNEIAEQSVETLWYNGKMYWLNWVDRLFRKDFLLFKELGKDIYSGTPWGVELGHINPAIHGYKTKEAVFNLIYKTGIAIGLGKERGGHILKADIMLTKKGPYILELTLRLSGGWESSYTTPKRGADFVGGALKLALGEKLDLNLWTEYFQYKNPNLFSSMLTLIPENSKDCMGRKFAEGSGFKREESIKNAYKNLLAKKFISKGNPIICYKKAKRSIN